MQEMLQAIFKKRKVPGTCDTLLYCPLFMYSEFFAVFRLKERQ